MIPHFPLHNPIKILIPTQNFQSFFPKASFILLLIFAQTHAFLLLSIPIENKKMKVHPMPRKRNITIQYGLGPRNLSEDAQNLANGPQKRLRRLPHIFSRVLELPFRSDADVVVEESPDSFRFVAETDIGGDVRAQMVEIYPGVIKIVIRGSGFVEMVTLDELEIDRWRFRLPETTRPELASAVCVDGELIVTVPKGEGAENEEGGGGGQVWEDRGGMGSSRLVLVQ